MGIKVRPRSNEPIRRTLKRLERRLQKEGVRRDMMRHRWHETETVRRRRQRHKNATKVRRAALRHGH